VNFALEFSRKETQNNCESKIKTKLKPSLILMLRDDHYFHFAVEDFLPDFLYMDFKKKWSLGVVLPVIPELGRWRQKNWAIYQDSQNILIYKTCYLIFLPPLLPFPPCYYTQ
jgi:hypothetical protein